MRVQDDSAADDGSFEEALRCFGLQAQEPEPAQEPDRCDVWPAHVDALNLFLACQEQWKLGIGMGGVIWRAAPSASVAQEARWLGLHGKRQATVAQQYRVIECEALRILNEREAQAARKS